MIYPPGKCPNCATNPPRDAQSLLCPGCFGAIEAQLGTAFAQDAERVFMQVVQNSNGPDLHPYGKDWQ